MALYSFDALESISTCSWRIVLKSNVTPDASIPWIILIWSYQLLILPKQEYGLQSTFEMSVVLSIIDNTNSLLCFVITFPAATFLFIQVSTYCSNVW